MRLILSPTQLRTGLWALLFSLISLSATAEERVVRVTTARLGDITTFQAFSAPATTLSLNESRVSAETSGTILHIPVRVGESVEKGALLTAIDCRDNLLKLQKAEAGLASLEARVTLATRQIQRTRSLRKSSNVSEERLNQQQADLQIAQAERSAQHVTIAQEKLNRDRCEITAPFAGVVRERLAGEGEWVNPGQAVIRLTDREHLEVSAQVSLDLIQPLTEAEAIQFESNRGVYPVTLRQIVPVINPLGRNQEVRLQFTATRALPGSSGRLLWHSRQAYLPADLPVRRGDTLGLFLADHGKARFVPLPEALEGQPAEVSLPADSQLILEGRQALSDGATIELAN